MLLHGMRLTTGRANEGIITRVHGFFLFTLNILRGTISPVALRIPVTDEYGAMGHNMCIRTMR